MRGLAWKLRMWKVISSGRKEDEVEEYKFTYHNFFNAQIRIMPVENGQVWNFDGSVRNLLNSCK